MYGAEAGNGDRHPAVERAAAVGCGFPANARVAQWESIRVTGGGSLVQIQPWVLRSTFLEGLTARKVELQGLV